MANTYLTSSRMQDEKSFWTFCFALTSVGNFMNGLANVIETGYFA